MKKILVVTLTATIFLVACHTAPKHGEQAQHQKANPYYQAALLQAAAEMQKTQDRNPASTTDDIKLEMFDKIKPNKFEVYVLPKVNYMNHKNLASTNEAVDADGVADKLYSKPSIYEVVAIANTKCADFAKNFKKYKPEDFFSADLLNKKRANLGPKATGAKYKVSQRRCAIIEVTSVDMKNINKALIKKDDVRAVRLFLDDQFNNYGYEVDIYDDANNIRTVRVANTEGSPSSSGLLEFPLDIPMLSLLLESGGQKVNVSEALEARLDGLSQHMLKKVNSKFEINQCEGFKAQYKDYYGQDIEVGWCAGMPWPQFVENQRFLAITQPVKF